MEKKLKPCTAEVLGFIIYNGSITGQDAIRALHMTELRSRISELKKAGYPIVGQYETKKNEDGTMTRYKRYRLEGQQ